MTLSRDEREKTFGRGPVPLLRLADLGDLRELARIEDECFREGRFQRGHLRWILRNPKAVTLVEDSGPSLSGAVMLLFEARACRVLSVAVRPAGRRKGLGSGLMRAAEGIAYARASTTMRLEVSTRNLAAIELYRRLGYKVDGLLPRYYSWGDDAYSMSKPLDGISGAPPESAAARNPP